MYIIEYSGSHIKTTESHTVVSNGFTQQLMLDTFPSSKGCLHMECVPQGEVVCNIVNISLNRNRIRFVSLRTCLQKGDD